jgi:anti-anti-sigma regulatory factor
MTQVRASGEGRASGKGGRFAGGGRRHADDEIHLVQVAGRVDAGEARALRDRLHRVNRPTVVDLRECDAMCPEGLHALLDGERAAVERRQRLVLVVPPGSALNRMLEIVAGHILFDVRPTLEEALVAVRDDRGGQSAEAAGVT